MTALRSALALLASFAITGTGGQQQAVDVGALFTRLMVPDKELVGGFLQVIDKAHQFDAVNNACGHRGVCHAFSAAAVTRRDGSTGVEAGILRQLVDGFGGVLFDITRPLMEAVGLGAVAREEVSFTTFVIDLIDSAIISATRVLAGRRVSRQFEQFSPLLTLVEPVMGLVRSIPPAYIGSMVDFAVDVTNVADRRSGLYNLVRAGGLGYAFGGDTARDGEANVCTLLDPDNEGSQCDDGAGGYYLLGMLNPINDNKLGQLLRTGSNNPVMNRNLIGTDVMKYNGFEIADIVNPKALLCKTNNLLSSMQTHVDVQEEALEYYELDAVDLDYAKVEDDSPAYDYTSGLEKVGEEGFNREDETAMRLYQRLQEIEEEQMRLTDDQERRRVQDPEETDRDKFDGYCAQFNLNAKRTFMKKMLDEQTNATVTDDEEATEVAIIAAMEDDDDDVDMDDVDMDDVVEVKRDGKRKEKEPQMNDLEALARLGDRSLLVDKLDVEEGNEQSDVEEYVTALDVVTNGKVEKVVIIEGKKKTLLVQFDSVLFRDAVLRASRSPEARSVTKARLRKPKVKDLKHVESLRH